MQDWGLDEIKIKERARWRRVGQGRPVSSKGRDQEHNRRLRQGLAVSNQPCMRLAFHGRKKYVQIEMVHRRGGSL